MLPVYDGKSQGAMWKLKVTIGDILAWTEKQDKPVTFEQLKAKLYVASDSVPSRIDPIVLSHLLWGFLNTNLSGDAFTTYGNVKRSHGFEAWRRVVKSLSKRTEAELLKLEGKVLAPVCCSHEGQVLMALEVWQGAIKDYEDAGGEELSKKRRRGGLLRMLPLKLREKVIWDLGADSDPEDIVEFLTTRLRSSSSWDDSRREAALLEDDEFLDEEGLDELHLLGPGADAIQIAAVYKKAAFRQRSRPFPRGRPAQRAAGPNVPGPRREAGPPRRRDDIRCPNCLETGHSAFECKKERVEQRKCFLCL